jgi:MraZ protein
MNHFLGEYECKLDTKGRMVLPAALKRQMPDVEREGLVINRGLETHLIIYTRSEWNRIMDKLSSLNPFERKSREFIRKFMRGATELTLDSAGRVLIPKTLQAYAGISTEIVLASQFNKIEVWAKERYDELWEDEGEEFAALAEEVVGNLERRKDEE